MHHTPVRRPVLFASALGLSLLVALSGCNEKKAPVAAPPPVVTVAEPIKQQITDFDEYTGRLYASDSVEIRARVTGYLDKNAFKDGSFVKAGDLLCVIDPRPYRAQFEAATAEVKKAEAGLDLAKQDLSRGQEALKAKAIPVEEVQTRASKVTQAEAALMSAKASLESSRLNLEFTEVKAPFAGKTSAASFSVGNLITPDTLLTSIVAVDPIHCKFELAESDIQRYVARAQKEGKMREGNTPPVRVEISLGDTGKFDYSGTLDFAENKVDPSTGTIQVRAVLENKDRALVPGYFVRVRVPDPETKDSFVVAERALGNSQGQRFAYVIGPDNTVQFRTVKLGREQPGGMRVVASGLSAGEKIVVDGLQFVRPGIKVDPKPGSMTGEAEPAPAKEKAGGH